MEEIKVELINQSKTETKKPVISEKSVPVVFNDDVDQSVKPKEQTLNTSFRAKIVFDGEYTEKVAEELRSKVTSAFEKIIELANTDPSGLGLGQRFTTTQDFDFEKLARMYPKNQWLQLGSMGGNVEFSKVIPSLDQRNPFDSMVVGSNTNSTYITAQDIKKLLDQYDNCTLLNYNHDDLAYDGNAVDFIGIPLNLRALSEYDETSYPTAISLNAIMLALENGVVFYDGLKKVNVTGDNVTFEFDSAKIKPVIVVYKNDDDQDAMNFKISTNSFVLNGLSIRDIKKI